MWRWATGRAIKISAGPIADSGPGLRARKRRNQKGN
nr:MAG TPA: hypothetical protein [Caudoviricetes sp.]